MRARINALYYREAGTFTTQEESRYAIACIGIEPHPTAGALVVATDGHTMIVIHDKGGECREPVNVRYSDSIAAFCTQERMLTVDDIQSISITDGDVIVASFYNQLVAKPFPPWKNVLPTAKPEGRFDYNSKYLRRCGDLDDSPWSRVSLWIGGEDKPTVVRVEGREEIACLVMPCRSYEIKYPSDFFDDLRPPKT